MNEIKDHCPFCGYKAEIHLGPHNDYVDINCPHCGNYRSNDWAIHSSDFYKYKDRYPVLSYWIRQHLSKKERVYLDRDLINNILTNINLPALPVQSENLIRLVGENVKKPNEFYIEKFHIVAPRIGAYDQDGVQYISEHLENLDILKCIHESGGELQASLTFNGWEEYEKIKNRFQSTKEKKYNFKKHKLTNDEKLWLSELLKYNFDKIELRTLKVSLINKLNVGFKPTELDKRLVSNNRLTLLGLWYIDEKNELINKTHEAILRIREWIKKNPKLDSIDSHTVKKALNISEREAKVILTLLFDLRFCNGGSQSQEDSLFNRIIFGSEPTAFDRILNYNDMEEALENYYNQFPHPDKNYLTTMQPKKMKMKLSFNENIWDEISAEYNISKQTFGKKINFVSDQFKRKIIFRDVEHAFTLYKNGFSKPAIILAGGIIEELLRLYLISKNIKPNKNTFDEYITQCEKNGLLKSGVSRLSDSIRHFRNLVHLERENEPKDTTSRSIASGAVSSIFTITNEF